MVTYAISMSSSIREIISRCSATIVAIRVYIPVIYIHITTPKDSAHCVHSRMQLNRKRTSTIVLSTWTALLYRVCASWRGKYCIDRCGPTLSPGVEACCMNGLEPILPARRRNPALGTGRSLLTCAAGLLPARQSMGLSVGAQEHGHCRFHRQIVPGRGGPGWIPFDRCFAARGAPPLGCASAEPGGRGTVCGAVTEVLANSGALIWTMGLAPPCENLLLRELRSRIVAVCCCSASYKRNTVNH